MYMYFFMYLYKNPLLTIRYIFANIVVLDGLSSNGRTTVFGSVNLGSSPGNPANFGEYLVSYF